MNTDSPKEKPFNPSDDDVQRVDDVSAGMDLETRIGQRFRPIAPTDDLEVVNKTLEVL